jgi:aspartate racemase
VYRLLPHDRRRSFCFISAIESEFRKSLRIYDPMDDEKQAHCLGLVGGLGVGATVHYYQELVRAHAARGSVTNLVMVHADMQRVLNDAAAGNTAQLASYLAELISRMARAGAQMAAIPAVTPHICAPELVRLSPIPIVSLTDVIAQEIRAKKFQRVALFGTRFTIESKMFGQLAGVDVALPRPEEITVIHETYLEIANTQRGSEQQYRELRKLAFTLIDRDGVDAIILAGTDLSLVFNETNTDFPYIDGARIHLSAIMRELFRRGTS